MVVRLREPASVEQLQVAAQLHSAPAVAQTLPGAWMEPWVVVDPLRWDGGTWEPGRRDLSLTLANAGQGETVLTAITVDAAWIGAASLTLPLILPAWGESITLALPLLPEGLKPGRLSGQIRLEGPGWERVIRLTLLVPKTSQPWLGSTAVDLHTKLVPHQVSLRATTNSTLTTTTRLQFFDQPVSHEPPSLVQRVDGGTGEWRWDLNLLPGTYRCNLFIGNIPQSLSAPAPHRWDWVRPGDGRLLVGAGQWTGLVQNIGAEPVELSVEPWASWLIAEPNRLSLAPGQGATITLVDGLSNLGEGETDLRLVHVATRETWAILPITRSLEGEMAIPAFHKAALQMRVTEEAYTSDTLIISNVGQHPLVVDVTPPPGLEVAEHQRRLTIPGRRQHAVTLKPDPAAITESTDLTLALTTNSAYPPFQSLMVPVHVERVRLSVDPLVIDLATVQYPTPTKRRLRIARSDDGKGRYKVTIPTEAEDWLVYDDQTLVARSGLRRTGPVEVTVHIRDEESGATGEVVVRADLQRPILNVPPKIGFTSRPRLRLQKDVYITGASKGLQILSVRSLHYWAQVWQQGNAFRVTVNVHDDFAPMRTSLQVFSNDPIAPVQEIPLLVTIKPNLWDRVRAFGIRWQRQILFAGALILAVGVVTGAAWGAWTWWRKSHTPPPGPVPVAHSVGGKHLAVSIAEH